MWPAEPISNYHCVYIRVHKEYIKNGMPSKSAFTNTPKEGDNLSSDWCKYCSPATSRDLISKQKNSKGEFKNPALFYIWKFEVIVLRQMDIPQRVEHNPLFNEPEIDGRPNNRAHAIIIGNKPINEAEFRTKMLRAGRWAIDPE
jgi:hypothetical protein